MAEGARLARATGALAVLVMGLGAWMTLHHPTRALDALPGGFRSHMMALELAVHPADVGVMAGDLGSPTRAALLNLITIDNYYVVSYCALFWALALLLYRRGSRWLALCGALFIALGGAFDYLENARIARVLVTRLADTTPDLMFAMREASLLKWTLVFSAALALAPAFWGAGRLSRVVASWFLVCALIGFAGLWWNPALEWALIMFSPGLIGCALLFLLDRAPRPGERAPGS